MLATQHATEVKLKNILYLTDFSGPAELALFFAKAIAREYDGRITAVHILTPPPYVYTTPEATACSIEALEKFAQIEMERVEGQLAGLPHETLVFRRTSVWPGLSDAIERCSADLVVLGTHGRTGAQKLLLGSVAEEIFRRVRVPVLTIGPRVKHDDQGSVRFQRILYATDFTSESLNGAPYAISLASENRAQLILLHVIHGRAESRELRRGQLSVAEIMHRLHEIVPDEVELARRPAAVVEFGDPRKAIVQAADERGADLIVLGIRERAGHFGSATHLENTTAHNVVAHAACPVMTVRL